MPAQSQFHLLKTRRFLPIFITQALQAFNDNVYKQALIVLLAFQLNLSHQHSGLLVTLAAGIFILPFFLFSATAGKLADHFDKAYLTRIIKFFEIPFIALGCYALYLQNVTLSLVALFLMGLHSTFFGPIKYAILPDHLQENELISGNALVESSTFAAILLGTIVGGIFILFQNGIIYITAIGLALAVVGWMSSFYIFHTKKHERNIKFSFNFIQDTWEMLLYAKRRKEVFLSILGISWFWAIGAIFLAQMTNFVVDILHAPPYFATLFFALFSIGVGLGSLACNKLLKGKISPQYVPIALLGISIFIFDMCHASGYFEHHVLQSPPTMQAFLANPHAWRIMADLLLLAICGGIYAVPLYATMQLYSGTSHRSRAIASNNVMNSLFMVASAILVAGILALGFNITHVFLFLAIINLFATIYICKIIPEAMVKSFVKWVLSSIYQVKVNGLENYPENARYIIIANHTSFLDVVLLSAFLPDKLTFAINKDIAASWWIKPLLNLVETFPIDPTSPMSMKTMIKVVRGGKKLVIFPEGRITVTGALMKIYEGPGMIADKAGAKLLPIRINGAQFSYFSRLKGKIKLRWFPKISLTILPPREIKVDETIKSRNRRRLMGEELYNIMAEMIFYSSDLKQKLFDSLIDARNVHKGKFKIAEDRITGTLSYNQLIMRSFILGKALTQYAKFQELIGVLLPTSVNTMITFFGLEAYGRVPAMLNYSSGVKNIISCCQAAALKTVITSKRFIRLGDLHHIIDEMKKQAIEIIYLEDIAKNIKFVNKLAGYLKSHFPYFHQRRFRKIRSEDPAVILFTSGSEGIPKGVALSHYNLQSNRYQLGAAADFNSSDIVFNCLPLFHCYGLTAGAFLPLMSGVKTHFYPTPLHYRIIPELVYAVNATIMFSTDTFLAGYAHYAHPYDFYSLRYLFAGAEKIKLETQQRWADEFGVRVFEGYGATETAPVVATNTAMRNKKGTVGCLLPGIQHRLEKVPGIHHGGKLWVKGPNIMLGYLDKDNPGKIVPLKDGWYDTGDVVDIDSDGFITIVGRVKRFAKIGGEMVSLAAVESYLSQLWPGFLHAAIALKDEKKGEQIKLITNKPEANREEIAEFYRKEGLPEIALPRYIEYTKDMPVLASGKIDYVRLKELYEN